MDRTAWLLRNLSPHSRILEIGPSHSPIAPKAAGWNSFVVDHAPQDELVAKYRALAIDTSRIEEVDAVWQGGPLLDAVPAAHAASFDTLIASHVIEHVPDFIGFFTAATHLLKPDGVIALAVPDHRFCFDFFKPITTTGDVLEARALHRQRHGLRTTWNQQAYSVAHGERTSWSPQPVPDLRFCDTFEAVAAAASTYTDESDAPYLDCHAWQFTPGWFQLVMLELGELGVCDWRIDMLEPLGAEFLCLLRRGVKRVADATRLQQRRMALLYQGLSETGEQIRLALSDAKQNSTAKPIPQWGALPLLYGMP